MIRVFIEAQAGSREKGLYDEQTLTYKRTRRINRPYPYPYGFVMGTRSEDGEAVDCYILTTDPLKAGTVVECQPIGLLEELRNFIYGVFHAFPDTRVQVGEILPKTAATEYIQKHRL